jgi:hypothetical protein
VSSGCESGQWPLSDIIGTHEVKEKKTAPRLFEK